jgi:TatD DNase family protein
MQLIDTHTHLYLPEFNDDRDEMVIRASDNGIVKLLMPNIDISSVSAMLAAAGRYKNVCLPMIGLHPTSVTEDYRSQLDELEKIFQENDFIAVGEIGIDLYWDKTHLTEQIDAMRRQVAFAVKNKLPVVIHSRESMPEVFSVIDEFAGPDLKGVLHAFSGSASDAQKAISLGFKIGIGGPITYKNSKLGEIIQEIGIEHVILETDSPYLTPVPFRGKRNESSYISIINKKLADVLGISEEESARITFGNSCRLFKI